MCGVVWWVVVMVFVVGVIPCPTKMNVVDFALHNSPFGSLEGLRLDPTRNQRRETNSSTTFATSCCVWCGGWWGLWSGWGVRRLAPVRQGCL